MPDVWDDTIDYFFRGNQPLTRRKCRIRTCRRQTQLELCTKHLQVAAGLQVKESQILGSGWGLYTTRDRGEDEFISRFTGNEVAEVGFTGPSEYLSWRGRGFMIDSSIERCSAACANSAANTYLSNNCCIKTYGGQCYIKTTKAVRSGDELYVAYGRTYRWK